MFSVNLIDIPRAALGVGHIRTDWPRVARLGFSTRDGGKELATIRVKFKGSDPPEGLARIKDNLIKFIPS